MIDNKSLDEMVRKLSGMMPESVQHVQADIEKNLKAGLSGAFHRMDLVTREEFEVQAAMLERTRERLSAMEVRVKALEKEFLAPRAQGDDNPAGDL
ncbi:accessory factor UbiK family protein [Ectothiorhodospira haloalkaliphila]|uniref:accessory factor UbiK family protein n=1 Tax=Ectothiorhodospira TaxID=1051 RepID=UPI001EE984B4|nr:MULTISPECIES: accessory factor UbiK family protein [Ectothiorhodospira]MCG5496561.1 accessory factor UbiK family protein [Ectothiorhodospira variabilis]MCG5526056.1 accessory factor UbiK family protein [Ectothiorhodospira haloalkaliphila]